MRVKDELFGKEILDADIQIVGKVHDVIFDKSTFEITDLVIKKQASQNRLRLVKMSFRWSLLR